LGSLTRKPRLRKMTIFKIFKICRWRACADEQPAAGVDDGARAE
jgi:hypothetical protein